MSHEKTFASTLNAEMIEYAYSMAKKAMERRDQSFAQTGLRAAKKKDQKLLIALERMAEVTGQMQEAQMGQRMRSMEATLGETKGTTEHQMCREAYRMVDEGTPIEHLQWIYGAAAWLCGYNR